MDRAEVEKYILDMPDEVLAQIQFSMPWQYDANTGGYKDEDGFVQTVLSDKDDSKTTRDTLQKECWKKFNRNPQFNTATRGLLGRLTGLGFETSSEITEIQEAIEEIELDPRNRLYNFWPKYVGRNLIEGELFQSLTLHTDGFVEVDFVDPAIIMGAGEDDSGIIFHPSKTLMPLIYSLDDQNGNKQQIPSIFCAYYPELIEVAAKDKYFQRKLLKNSHSRKRKYSKFNGYYRFIVAWDRGFLTRRAVSYMRTTVEWLNYYENLKKYEIDHKKSSGAYMWIFSFTEPRAFKLWLSLSDEDRRKTGLTAKKTPGGSLILPPGVEVEVKNPNLTRISEQDTDIMEMISSGLNEPEDVTLGRAKGSYASIKASRGPMADRTADEIAYFERFLKYDFWQAVFFLKSSVSDFKNEYKVREATSFGKDGEPKFENRKKKAFQLIDISFPVSESIDYEGRAKGLMGVKHGPATDTLGIPYSEVAKRLGFGNYGKMRLRHATEKEVYPELIYSMDAESMQEQMEAEPTRQKSKPTSSSRKPSSSTEKK
jgi:hypothetical protein